MSIEYSLRINYIKNFHSTMQITIFLILFAAKCEFRIFCWKIPSSIPYAAYGTSLHKTSAIEWCVPATPTELLVELKKKKEIMDEFTQIGLKSVDTYIRGNVVQAQGEQFGITWQFLSPFISRDITCSFMVLI